MFYEKIADFYKALADKNRLNIIFELAGGEKSVSQIIDETKLSQPLVSHHLKELKHKFIVKTKRKGPFIFYELTEPTLIDLIRLTNQFLVELMEKNREPMGSGDFELPFCEIMKNMHKIKKQFFKEEI